ncbi:MAG: leucine-rich repeat protein [Paludibacteraceae bacterium]|nr:leucine-rich repeat protein [Paludibacteraceae bacterium]
MKHKFYLFLAVMLLSLMPVGKASAEVVKDGIHYIAEYVDKHGQAKETDYYMVTDDRFLSSENYNYLSGNVYLKDKLYGKRVEVILSNAFSSMKANVNIFCPNTLKRIKQDAFLHAEGLQSIRLNEGLEKIESNSFLGCSNLTSVNFPTTLLTIPKQAFLGCSLLPSVTFTNVKSIEERAFKNCTSLVSINGGNLSCTVQTIGDEAFYGCTQLQTIKFASNKLISIGASCFENCTHLTNIILPASLTTIGQFAFKKSGLKVVTNNRTSPQTIKANVFQGVDLSQCILYVPKGCKAAYQAADVWNKFGYILEPGEQPVDIQPGEEKIGPVPTGLHKIGDLTYELHADQTATLVQNKAYKDISGALVIPASVKYGSYIYTVTAMKDFAFAWCDKITSVSIPNTITEIPDQAFDECSALKSVTLPAALTKMGIRAFAGTALTAINIPSTVTEFGNGAFSLCEALTSVTVPAGVKVVPDDCFYGCSNLKTIKLQEGLDEIKAHALCNTNITSLIIPESVTSVRSGLPSSLTSIRTLSETPPATTLAGTFQYINKSTCVLYVPAGSLSAYQTADGWKEFKNIQEKGVNEKIKYGKLYYQLNENLTAYVTCEKNEPGNYAALNGEITVEKTVSYQGLDYTVNDIGSNAFRYATGITKVNLPAIMDEIRSMAFNGCSNLAQINIPATLTWLDDDAFGGTKLFNDNKDANGAVYYDGCLLALTEKLSGDYTVKEGTWLIASNVFMDQDNLTSITLPEGLQVLCNSALSDMLNLETVTLPSSLQYIGGGFLHNCYMLGTIYNYAEVPYNLSDTYCFDGVNQAMCTLYVPKGSKNGYSNAAEWKNFPMMEMEPKSFTVTFVDYDGTELKTETVEVGNAAIEPYDPTREGYTFTGWDKEFDNIQADQTVTAQYEQKKYIVIFLDWNGNPIDTQEVLHGESAVAPADPTREGHTFIGWDKEFDIVNGSMNVTAQYAAKVWTVTYLNWDDSLIGTEQVVNGEDAKGMVATRVGWIFGQWYNTKNFEYVDMKNITSDLTVKAEYSGEILFDVTYRVNGETTFQIQAVYGFDARTIYYNPTEYPKIPEKESDDMYDYTFAGWEPEVTYVTDNIVLTAVFEATPRKFTVSFYDWDDSLIEEQEVAYGSPAEAPTPERTGYTFTGWDKSVGYITGNLIVKAQYTINSYSVTFVDYDDAVLRTAQIVEYGSAAVPPADPVRTGYTFTGWDQDYKNVTGDMTVKAQYTINHYTVRFLNWDGTVLQSSEWEYNTTPVYSGETPVRAEDEENTYAFKGWDKEIAVATAAADYTAQFTATAKAVYFTVTYYDWDLTVLGTEKVEEGHDAQGLNPEPTREGYTFTGWSKPLTNITSDLSVQATYKENPGTGIDEVESQKSKVESTKFLRDGVLYILRNRKTYNAQGQVVQ